MSGTTKTVLQQSIEQIDKLTMNLSRQLMPVNFREALGWSAFLWTACPTYRQAIIRGISYFMTEVEVVAAEGVEGKVEEIKQARQLLNRNFASTDMAMKALQEAVGFGGACVYLFFPVIRTLTCPKCAHTMDVEYAMREQDVTYDLKTGDYKGKCRAPECGKTVVFKLSEMRYRDEAHRAQLRLIPLSLCRMKYNPISGERRLFVNCQMWEDVYKLVRDGDPLIHSDTPRAFIDSARLGCEMEMDQNSFFYLGFCDASIIDMNLGGWSLPPFFYAFNDVIAILLLQHYNTTILADYIPPLRYVAPPPNVGTARNLGNEGRPFDPTHAMTNSFSDFRSKVTTTIQNLKADPSKIGIFPYPVQFSYLGLEGGQLLSVELLQHYNDSLIYNMGLPSAFGRGGLQVQVASPSLIEFVLFERFWSGFVSNVNKMYQWANDELQKSEHWPDMYVNLIPPVRYADPAMLPIMHQRVQEGELSNDTFNRMIGANTSYERRMSESEQADREARFMDADRQKQRQDLVKTMLGEVSPDMQAYQQIQASAQMQQQQQSVLPGAGAGTPVPASAPVPAQPPITEQSMTAPAGTPAAATNPAEQQVLDRLMASARLTAQELSRYPVQERAQVLRVMDTQQPEFRGLVEQAIEDMENQARKQGLQASRGQ